MQTSPLQPPLGRVDDAAERRPVDRRAQRRDDRPGAGRHRAFRSSGPVPLRQPSALCALFGFSREELLAMTFQDISFAEDLPHCFVLLEQLTAGAIPQFTHEKRFERNDGTFIYTRVIVSAVARRARSRRVLPGDRRGPVRTVVDRSGAQGRRGTAVARARSVRHRHLPLRSSTRKRSTGRTTWRTCSASSPARSWQSLERLLGAIHPDDLPAVLEHYERSKTEGAYFDHEFRIVHPDASVRWISDRARMSPNADGTPRFLTGACIDVTARHDSLSREHVARSSAERAIRSRDEVLGRGRARPAQFRPRHPDERRRRRVAGDVRRRSRQATVGDTTHRALHG